MMTIARIWPRPGVVISSGSSDSACAPATISRPDSRLRCGLVLTMPDIRIAST